MEKIVIIGGYFGKLRDDFPVWLNSCRHNKSIDWLIFTDQEISRPPSNVRVVSSTLSGLKDMIQSKFDFPISLERPYKLCDYKPAYGYIFQEYIKDYDVWGYCDFDMIFGDIRKFITSEILQKNQKILQYGHLSLYRNSEENNKFFMKDHEQLYYKTVYQNDKSFVFDEMAGILAFYIHEGIPIYISDELIDISTYIHSRLTLACEDDRYLPYTTINFKYQTFLYKKGKVFFVYWGNGTIHYEECIYLHMSQRVFPKIESDNFLVTKNGFLDLGERKIDLDLIRQVNRGLPRPLEEIEYYSKRVRRAIRLRIKKNQSLLTPDISKGESI